MTEINNLFPGCIKKTRVARGNTADEMIVKHPTPKEFLSSLSPNVLFCEERVKDDRFHIITVYLREDNRFGYCYNTWCMCPLCTRPIDKCFSGSQLETLRQSYLRSIQWFDSYNILLEYAVPQLNMPGLSRKLKKFKPPIVDAPTPIVRDVRRPLTWGERVRAMPVYELNTDEMFMQPIGYTPAAPVHYNIDNVDRSNMTVAERLNDIETRMRNIATAVVAYDIDDMIENDQ